MDIEILKEINNMMDKLVVMAMRETIDIAWSDSEDELMEKFHKVLATPNDDKNPGPFTVMQAVGTLGTALETRYHVDTDKLIQILKDSDLEFVKELQI